MRRPIVRLRLVIRACVVFIVLARHVLVDHPHRGLLAASDKLLEQPEGIAALEGFKLLRLCLELRRLLLELGADPNATGSVSEPHHWAFMTRGAPWTLLAQALDSTEETSDFVGALLHAGARWDPVLSEHYSRDYEPRSTQSL